MTDAFVIAVTSVGGKGSSETRTYPRLGPTKCKLIPADAARVFSGCPRLSRSQFLSAFYSFLVCIDHRTRRSMNTARERCLCLLILLWGSPGNEPKRTCATGEKCTGAFSFVAAMCFSRMHACAVDSRHLSYRGSYDPVVPISRYTRGCLYIAGNFLTLYRETTEHTNRWGNVCMAYAQSTYAQIPTAVLDFFG